MVEKKVLVIICVWLVEFFDDQEIKKSYKGKFSVFQKSEK